MGKWGPILHFRPHTCRLVPKVVAKTCCLGVRFGYLAFRKDGKKIRTPGGGKLFFFYFPLSPFVRGEQDPNFSGLKSFFWIPLCIYAGSLGGAIPWT